MHHISKIFGEDQKFETIVLWNYFATQNKFQKKKIDKFSNQIHGFLEWQKSCEFIGKSIASSDESLHSILRTFRWFRITIRCQQMSWWSVKFQILFNQFKSNATITTGNKDRSWRHCFLPFCLLYETSFDLNFQVQLHRNDWIIWPVAISADCGCIIIPASKHSARTKQVVSLCTQLYAQLVLYTQH